MSLACSLASSASIDGFDARFSLFQAVHSLHSLEVELGTYMQVHSERE
jgi:hypothetical protein